MERKFRVGFGWCAWCLLLGALIAAATATSALGTQAQAAHDRPVLLGNVSAPNGAGYGEAHPRKIFNGGDPSGLVLGIHWKHWGSRKATGWGTGLFVWPGRTVAEGVRARARVVAFHLGTCEGRAAYNAVEWFFPKYHQRFHPGIAGEICTEHRRHHLAGFRPRHCRGLNMSRLSRVVSVTTENMTCRSARRLIRTSPAQRWAVGGGRFRHDGFYCGSMGWSDLGPPSIFECALDRRSVVFEVYVQA